MQESAKVVAMPPKTDAPLSNRQQLQQQAKDLMWPFVQQLEAYDIPDDKLEAVIDFATKTFAKYHRHMKQDRMLRKIVTEFKLKLLPKTDTDGTTN